MIPGNPSTLDWPCCCQHCVAYGRRAKNAHPDHCRSERCAAQAVSRRSGPAGDAGPAGADHAASGFPAPTCRVVRSKRSPGWCLPPTAKLLRGGATTWTCTVPPDDSARRDHAARAPGLHRDRAGLARSWRCSSGRSCCSTRPTRRCGIFPFSRR